jgi:hypothetical protein
MGTNNINTNKDMLTLLYHSDECGFCTDYSFFFIVHFSDMTPLFGQLILSKNLQLECILHCLIHFSDMTPLFGQWILSKYLQFILLLSRIWNLTFCHFRLKDLFLIFWDLSRTTAGFLMSALCLNTERIHCPNNGVMSEKCIKQWRIHSNCRFLERIHCPNNGVMSEKCIKQWRIHSNCRFLERIHCPNNGTVGVYSSLLNTFLWHDTIVRTMDSF